MFDIRPYLYNEYMWKFIYNKVSKDPTTYGTIISRMKKCGKKNCRCNVLGQLHRDYYLKWRELNPLNNKSIVHRKYIRKEEVGELSLKLSKLKGFYIWDRLTQEQQTYFLIKNPQATAENIQTKVYEMFRKPPYPILSEDDLTKIISETP